MKQSFYVFGKVQGVMFRRTFVLGALKRGLRAGATNDTSDRNKVSCSLEGDEEEILELISDLQSLEELNSWGAKVDRLELQQNFIEIDEHEVHGDNVDDKNWSSGVEFFL